jgi:hypothetical protein
MAIIGLSKIVLGRTNSNRCLGGDSSLILAKFYSSSKWGFITIEWKVIGPLDSLIV